MRAMRGKFSHLCFFLGTQHLPLLVFVSSTSKTTESAHLHIIKERIKESRAEESSGEPEGENSCKGDTE